MRKIFNVIALCSAALVLEGYAGAQVSCNRFEVLTKLDNKQLKVVVQSDLPEDSRIVVTVTRRYWRKGRKGASTLDYYNKDHALSELRSGAVIDLGQGVFDKEIKRLSEMAAFAGRGAVVVDRAESRVRMRVALTTNQTNEGFGEHNKDLSGSKVRQDGAYRGVKVIRYVEMSEVRGEPKKKKPGRKSAPMTKAIDFEVGRVYAARQKLPLKAHCGGKDLVAVRKGGSVGRQSLIYVDRKVEREDGTWFRVAAGNTPEGGAVNAGWLEAKEFGRKKHRTVEAPGLLDGLMKMGWSTPADKKLRYRLRGKPSSAKSGEGGMLVHGIIELDEGLSREEATLWARLGAWEVLERAGGAAAVVQIARMGDAEARSGQVTILPKGKASAQSLAAGDLDETSFGALMVTARLEDSFFKERPPALAAGTEIYVKKEGSFEVRLYAAPTWQTDEKAAHRVAKGTSGTVLESRYIEAAGKTELRYRLELEGGKKGWAPGSVVFKF